MAEGVHVVALRSVMPGPDPKLSQLGKIMASVCTAKVMRQSNLPITFTMFGVQQNDAISGAEEVAIRAGPTNPITGRAPPQCPMLALCHSQHRHKQLLTESLISLVHIRPVLSPRDWFSLPSSFVPSSFHTWKSSKKCPS